MKTRHLIGLASCLLCCVPVSAQQLVAPLPVTNVIFRYLASPPVALGRTYSCSVFNASNRTVTITGTQVLNVSSPTAQNLTPAVNSCGGLQGTPSNFALLPGKVCSVVVMLDVQPGGSVPHTACRVKHTGPAQSLIGTVGEFSVDAAHPEGEFRYVLTMQETGPLTPSGTVVVP